MRRILLVDDNPGDARLVIELTRLVEPDAYDFTEARSMAEARAALDDQDFAAVFVDLGLPDGVGVDNVRILAAASHPQFPQQDGYRRGGSRPDPGRGHRLIA